MFPEFVESISRYFIIFKIIKLLFFFHKKQATHLNDLGFLKNVQAVHDNLRKGQLPSGGWIKDLAGATVLIVFDKDSETISVYLASSFISDTL